MHGTLRSGPRPALPDPRPSFVSFGRPVAERVSDSVFRFSGYGWQGRDGVLDVAEAHYQDLGAPEDSSAQGSVRTWVRERHGDALVEGISVLFWTHLLDVLSNDHRYREQVAGLSPAGLALRMRDAEWVSGVVDIGGTSVVTLGVRFMALTGLVIASGATLVTVVGSEEFTSGPYRLAAAPTPSEAEAP
ncbi:MAG: hypothetical protein JWR01_2950 [Subtercola sp.]|nr:hypothetical protein [Subtercola sp.]